MTAPIIPADKWPKWADRHCWDEDGAGEFYGMGKQVGVWYAKCEDSRFPMPEGWDWRVPLMRPSEQAPAIDLGQFREAVEMAMEVPLNSDQRQSLQRLLALIDRQGKEPATHYHCAEGIWGTAKRLRRYAKLNKANLMGQTMEEAAAYIEAMQPTKGEEAMQPTKGEEVKE